MTSDKMTLYRRYKADAVCKAIDWQADFNNHNYSYAEIARFQNYFERLGKRYGLLKEFRENAII